jgi:DNA-binding transcriptional LysR family regulator
VVNTVNVLRSARSDARSGISVLSDYAVANDLVNGRLIRVLPKWSLPTGGIHALFPSARFRPVKVRAFTVLLLSREAQRLALI